jgi:1,4-alpha-glucan branching enzyme
VTRAGEPTASVGSCAIVLHTHLPWLAHHGSWPVGEEWLYQSWAASYLPVAAMLRRLADEGRRDLLTLGVTPVLAAQLDDPYCLREFHTWLGFWSVRAQSMASRRSPADRATGAYEFTQAQQALAAFDDEWRHGASPVLRALSDSGAVELLGGPASHPFQPLLDHRVARFALGAGLDDAAVRLGARPTGIWAPECGYRPGLEEVYAQAGVQRFLVDGPTLLGAGRGTDAGWTVGGTDVVAFGRDLVVTYRVWSPRKGYPGSRWYRDFHTYDHDSGLKPARVTSRSTGGRDKAPYDPDRAAGQVRADAADFVDVVRRRLLHLADQRGGRPGLVVAAYDTELFGHWWHEGPAFLEQVLRLLPEAGVRATTLRCAAEAGHVEGRVDLGPGSWGSGKDWRVWDGAQVADLVDDNARLQKRWLDAVDGALLPPAHGRDPALDQLSRDALLALSSDWAFMVTKDSAAEYARERATGHLARFHRLADAIGRDPRRALALAALHHADDGPFAHLDARALRRL